MKTRSIKTLAVVTLLAFAAPIVLSFPSAANAISPTSYSITQSYSPNPVYPGDTMTITVEMNATEEGYGTNVVLNDALPANTSFVSAHVVDYYSEGLFSVSTGFYVSNMDHLRLVDFGDGDDYATTPILLSGETVLWANGMAMDPTTDTIYVLLRVSGEGFQQRLATLDIYTGTATLIGSTSYRFAGITFGSDGTLYGVTGSDPTQSESIFTIDKTTAAATFQFAMTADDDGEAIAFNPEDGLIYRLSGWGSPIYQAYDPSDGTYVDIIPSGDVSNWANLNFMSLYYIGSGQFIATNIVTGEGGVTGSSIIGSNGIVDDPYIPFQHASKGILILELPVPDNCTELAGVVTCPLGWLGHDAYVRVEIVVEVDDDFVGPISNGVTISALDFETPIIASMPIDVQDLLAETGMSAIPYVFAGSLVFGASSIGIAKRKKKS